MLFCSSTIESGNLCAALWALDFHLVSIIMGEKRDQQRTHPSKGVVGSKVFPINSIGCSGFPSSGPWPISVASFDAKLGKQHTIKLPSSSQLPMYTTQSIHGSPPRHDPTRTPQLIPILSKIVDCPITEIFTICTLDSVSSRAVIWPQTFRCPFWRCRTVLWQRKSWLHGCVFLIREPRCITESQVV